MFQSVGARPERVRRHTARPLPLLSGVRVLQAPGANRASLSNQCTLMRSAAAVAKGASVKLPASIAPSTAR